MRTDERIVRERLGVPASATEVVVVAESSHWDPNWLLPADRYYRLCVRPTLDRALDALRAEPSRVFGLECLFFVDRYWQDRPERRTELGGLVDEGRLRLTGSGVTTPDTLLPEDELILRDLLLGQEWLRRRGMAQEPRMLYLVDEAAGQPRVATPFVVDDPDVEVVATKPADRGPGVIVRLRDWSRSTNGRTVGLTWASDTDRDVTTAHLSDALERDVRPLDVRDATIEVPLAGHLTTLRISSGPD